MLQATDAEACSFGEGLLGESGRAAVAPQQIAK
jgi:hypothetical protein